MFDYLYFQKTYLYAKNLEEDIHKDLMINTNVLDEIAEMDRLVPSNDKSDIIDVDYLDPKCQNLVTFDDFVT